MSPRPHHYEFAHRLLPGTLLALSAGRSWTKMLLDPGLGPSFLAHLWATCGATAGVALSEAGLSLSLDHAGPGRGLIVIALPQALEAAEAHFVAALVDTETYQTLRYLTLEKAALVPTMLCEWTRDAHVNLGDGPPATLEHFVAAVHRIVSNGGPPS